MGDRYMNKGDRYVNKLQPQPLRDVAAKVGAILGVCSGLVTSAVTWGVIQAQTGDAILGLLGFIPGLIAALGTALAAVRTARNGEPLVTPVSSPRAADGTPLIPQQRVG